MHKILKTIAAMGCVGLAAVFMPSCDDNDLLPGNGVEQAQWAEINDVDLMGEILIYEFESPSYWTASCSDEWCEVLTPVGYAGQSSLRLKVAPNEGLYGRQTTVNIYISGYAEPVEVIVRQGEGFLEKGDGIYRDVNEWVYGYMAANYLWNEKIPEMTLDYSVNYQAFLKSILDGVGADDDANHDDGYWVDGQRVGYYTYIESAAPLSRAAGDKMSDSGLSIIPTILGPNDDDPCGFAVRWVTPGSPADQAGVRRGDFISTVNKVAVTQTNYQNLGSMVINGNVTIDLNDVEFVNGVATVTKRVASVLVGKDTYVDPSIYKSSVLSTVTGKKIGYIMYFGFHTDYDARLNDIFRQFKSEGVEELIIDLRYNPGGHILSSTVLGTLIAGNEYAGKTYVRTTYNATRTAAGEVGEYKIGDPRTPESGNGYTPISDALNNSLGLKQVFVIGSGTTASASELLINGLRGLDITVNLIGSTTHGKNVGMEGWQKRFGNYNFVFYPVTFYCENAKGFRDYSNGFTPDLPVDDSNIYPGDFGTEKDYLCRYAISWASTGQKPAGPSKAAAYDEVRVLKSTKAIDAPLSRRKGGSLMLPREI